MGVERLVNFSPKQKTALLFFWEREEGPGIKLIPIDLDNERNMESRTAKRSDHQESPHDVVLEGADCSFCFGTRF